MRGRDRPEQKTLPHPPETGSAQRGGRWKPCWLLADLLILPPLVTALLLRFQLQNWGGRTHSQLLCKEDPPPRDARSPLTGARGGERTGDPLDTGASASASTFGPGPEGPAPA